MLALITLTNVRDGFVSAFAPASAAPRPQGAEDITCDALPITLRGLNARVLSMPTQGTC